MTELEIKVELHLPHGNNLLNGSHMLQDQDLHFNPGPKPHIELEEMVLVNTSPLL